MTGKTHRMIGMTAGLGYYLAATAPIYNPATFGAVAVVSYIGALLPDIDSTTGDIWHTLPFGHTASELVDPFLQHRNITHSLLGIVLVGWAAHVLFFAMPSYWGIDNTTIWIAFLIGYGSHLLADSLTVEGIPVLYPFGGMYGIPPKPFEGVRIVTGKWFENLIIFPLVNLILIGIFITKWAIIKTILFK